MFDTIIKLQTGGDSTFMPKITRVDSIAVHTRKNSALFSKKQKQPIMTDDGSHLTNNIRLNNITKLSLDTVDKLTPIIKKFPKFGKIIVLTFEKVIKISEKNLIL